MIHTNPMESYQGKNNSVNRTKYIQVADIQNPLEIPGFCCHNIFAL